MILAAFLNYLQYERRLSPLTLQAYQGDLVAFDAYCKASFQVDFFASPEALSGLNSSHVRAWLGSMQLSPKSMARKASSLKSLVKYACAKGILQANVLRVRLPKTGKSLPAFVPLGPLQTLLDSAPWPAGWQGARDRLILELLYGCGLRRAELISLQRAAVQLNEQVLRVTGKGRKVRVVPFGPTVKKVIELYSKELPSAIASRPDGPLLVANSYQAAYPQLIHRTVQKYLLLIPGLSQHSPHVLRHSYATHLMDNGADLNAVKELMGHSSLAATQVYLHTSRARLKAAHRQAHPKAEN